MNGRGLSIVIDMTSNRSPGELATAAHVYAVAMVEDVLKTLPAMAEAGGYGDADQWEKVGLGALERLRDTEHFQGAQPPDPRLLDAVRGAVSYETDVVSMTDIKNFNTNLEPRKLEVLALLDQAFPSDKPQES